MTSRGIRNHNPGNIRKSKDKWQGLAEKQTDKEFFVFEKPSYGIRALAKVLITYQDKYNLQTIWEIINRYAPKSENPTSKYAQNLAEWTGFGMDQKLNLHTFEHLEPLVKAIIRQENGEQPYTEGQITKGLVLAGVEPLDQALNKSRTIKGAKISSASVGLTVASEALQEVSTQIEPLVPYLDVLKWVFIGLSILGIGITVYARIDDKNKGLR